MKFCQQCGNELLDEYVACPKCGCPCNNINFAVVPKGNAYLLVEKLSERLKTYGIIWIVIGIIQIILGIFVNWFILIVGVLNIIFSLQDFKYSKDVLEKPSGIVQKFQSLTAPIITLIYNLLIGGVIGVIGSIYYFVAIRSFVMENKDVFATFDNKTQGN